MTYTSPGTALVMRSKEHLHRALELRLQGWNYIDISAELGLDDSTVQRLVQRAMTELNFENVETAQELRNLILLRNDKVIEGLLPKAIGGDLFAVDRLIKVQEQSARLAGSFPQVEHDGREQFSGPIVVLPAMLEPPPSEGVPMPDVVQGQLAVVQAQVVVPADAETYLEVPLEEPAEVPSEPSR